MLHGLPSSVSDGRCPPSEKGYSVSRLTSRTRGVFPKSRQKKTAPLIDSCSRQSSSRGTDGTPTQELAEALLQGRLLTGRLALAAQAGSLTEMEHLLLPDTCPELAAGCVSQLTGCPGWRETTGTPAEIR